MVSVDAHQHAGCGMEKKRERTIEKEKIDIINKLKSV